jgi:hypothetical protein
MAAKPQEADVSNLFKRVVPEKKQADAKAKKPRQVSFYIPDLAFIQLKTLAAEERTTQQALILDGLNEVFKKHGKPPIA